MERVKPGLLRSTGPVLLTVLTWVFLVMHGPDLPASEDDGYIEGRKWRESKVSLPPYPDSGDLVDLLIDTGGSRYSYRIDTRSLNIGKDDVVHYTIVISSSDGAQNVLHEGIRCETREYKPYAYGSSEARFVEVAGASWSEIREGGAMRHREQLYGYYFCSQEHTYTREDILLRIRYPEESYVNQEYEF